MSSLSNTAQLARRADQAFDPVAVTAGAASWWLRNATFSGNVNSVPDLLGGASAVAGTHPLTGNADGTMTCTGSNGQTLLLPLSTATNGTTKWWISMHVRQRTFTNLSDLFNIDSAGGGSASLRKCFCQGTTTGTSSPYEFHVFNVAATQARRGRTTGNPFTIDQWRHVTVELALNLESSPGVPAADALRGVMTIDGVVQSLTITDSLGTPGAFPTVMSTPTGSITLFGNAANPGANYLVGDVSRNIIGGNGGMALATEGCLTPAARLALGSFERPN